MGQGLIPGNPSTAQQGSWIRDHSAASWSKRRGFASSALKGGSGILFPLGMRSSTSCKLQNEMMIHGLSSPFLGKTALLEKGREEKEQSREICHCSLPEPPFISSIFLGKCRRYLSLSAMKITLLSSSKEAKTLLRCLTLREVNKDSKSTCSSLESSGRRSSMTWWGQKEHS